MSTAANTDATATLARSLLRLARTGAYAMPSACAPAHYDVLSPRNTFAAPIAAIADDAILQAQALGWLTAAGQAGGLQLSKRGRRALKREISASPQCREAADAAPRPANARAAKAASSAPRTPQRSESPLLWLRNRKDRGGQPLITQAQYEAGTRFACDYTRGQMQGRVTASWSLTAPCLRTGTAGGGVEIGDAALAARDRLYAAMRVIGPEMGHLLIDVCCHDIGLESAERARGWPVRSGKVVLDMGLTALARHYGLEATPAPRATSEAGDRRPAARRWSDPGFTPTLTRWQRSQPRETNRDADAKASV